MDITTNRKCSAALPSGAVQNFPANWSGSVDDALGAQLLKDGAAVATLAEAAAPTLTAMETAVLKAAAGEIIAQHQGQPVPAGEPAATEPDPLEGLSRSDLNQLAKHAGVDNYKRLSRDELVAALHAKAQP